MSTRRQIRTFAAKEGITLNEAGKQMIKQVIGQANHSNVKMIVGDDKVRAQKCAQAIGEAIKQLEQQFDCVFTPCIQVTPDGNMGSFLVRPKPRGGPNNGGKG